MASYESAKATLVYTAIDQYQAESDAKKIRKALLATPVDTKSVVEALGDWTNEQRLVMCLVYYNNVKRSLHEDLHRILKGPFQKLCLALITSTINMDAELVHKATKGLGTDEALLLEVLCTRTFSQMKQAQKAFKRKYDEEMSEVIKDDTSGSFKRFCIRLLERGGDHEGGGEVDEEQASKDAQTLYDAGEGRKVTDEDTFITMLIDNSYSHMRAVFSKYKDQVPGPHGMEEAIQNEFSHDIQYGLLTLVKVIKSTPEFFAEKLHKAIKKHKDEKIIRIIVTRSEVDLGDIMDAYERLYSVSLYEALQSYAEGPYLDMLISVLQGKSSE